MKTVGDLASFSVGQEGDIGICEAQRDGAVAIVDLLNRISAQLAVAMKPKPWWAIWR